MISILMVVLMIAQTFSRLIIYADFKVNQDYIIEVLCINKDKPSTNCNGKCHLKEQLQKEQEREQTPVNNFSQKFETQFVENTETILNVESKPSSLEFGVYKELVSEPHQGSVFHPPQV